VSPRSRTLAIQSVISGSIRDGVTGGPPHAPVTVRLLDRDHPDQAPYPLAGLVTADARFSFHGDPDTALPRLAASPYRLRVEASARGYAPATVDVDIPATPGQPASQLVPVPLDGPAPVRLFTGDLPVEDLELVLQPNQVRLEGRVVVSNDPNTAVPGATVRLAGHPDATTDPRGRFAFAAPLPRVASVDLTVSANGFDDKLLTHELDYRRPINSIVVVLKR
jgi:hypothetical protein